MGSRTCKRQRDEEDDVTARRHADGDWRFCSDRCCDVCCRLCVDVCSVLCSGDCGYKFFTRCFGLARDCRSLLTTRSRRNVSVTA